MSDFGALRSLLQGQPSEAVWRMIVSWVDAAEQRGDARALEEGVAYAQGHLRRWPDAMLITPDHWLERALLGDVPPGMRLVRHIGIPLCDVDARPGVATLGRALDHEAIEALDVPELANVRHMNLRRGSLGRQGLQRLASATHLTALRSLDLGDNGIDGPALGVLADAPALRHVERLELWDNPLGNEGMRALQAAELPALHNLELGGVGLDDEGVDVLLATPFAPQLRRLYLWNNDLTAAGLSALMRAPCAPQFEALELNDNPLGADGARVLGDTPHLQKLRSLTMGNTGLGDVGASALARSRCITGLDYLELGRDDIGPGGMRALAGSSLFHGVNRLNLIGNPLGPAGASALAACEGLGALQQLSLANTDIGAAGAEALASSPHLTGLERLFVTQCELGDWGALSLLTSPSLRATLKGLRLDANELTPMLLRVLLQRGESLELEWLNLGRNNMRGEVDDLTRLDMPNLRELYFWTNGVEASGVRRLVQAPWFGQLTALDLDYNLIGDEGLLYIIDRPEFSLMERLEVANQYGDGLLTDASLRALARCEHATSLRVLSLTGIDATDEGWRALATSPHLGALRTLRVDQDTVSASGARILASATTLHPSICQHFEEMALKMERGEL